MGRPVGLLLAVLLLAKPTAPFPIQESPPSVPTAVLRGRVDFRREPRPPTRRAGISDLGMPAPRDVPDQRQAIVYLETAPRAAFEEREGARVTLDQKNENFAPHVLAITTGTVVDFRNDDRTYHNVFSLSKTKPFDLGRYAAGETKSVRFDRPGVVRVFCEIHSHMSAFIVVFAHRYFALTNAEGEYRIEGIPPGAYTVSVWHSVLATESKPIRIGDGGGEVEVDFSLS
ncbi:MAG TPA: carboxypeptidase regulatory-like domain-containing protein [Vicinamibacteria bacterium]|nr:carboxypeptidase regulatory-like domain-containing protein [Vicinamibacteria bacterium]